MENMLRIVRYRMYLKYTILVIATPDKNIEGFSIGTLEIC